MQPTIVYIITKLELGGAQKVCLALFEGLPELGINSWLISGTQGPLVQRAHKHSQAVLLTHLTREISPIAIINECRTFWHIVKHLRTLNKQCPNVVVHTHSTKAGILGRWAAFFAGISHRVHTIHGYAFHPHQSRVKWWPVYLCELVTSLITTHFVCVSQVDAETGIRLFPRFAKKYSLIRAATDVEQISTDKTQANTATFIIGTVACFKPQKNLFDLLEAFKRVHAHYPHARLEIIGDGMQRPAMQQWLQQNNLTSVVTLHGWQPDITTIAQHWHAFALTSLWEGLPCAVIEARLLKLPVIAYKTGGIPEVITHGVNGLLYEQKDVPGVVEGIKRMISDKDFYTKLAQHEDNFDAFTYQHMLKQHDALYRKLITQ